MQRMPREHPRDGRDVACIVDRDQVSSVRGTPALPAHGGLSGARVLSGAHEASALGAGRVEVAVFDSDASMPRIHRGMVYLGACLIAGIRLAREIQVNVRVIPTSHAINESVDLAHEIFNCVFRKVPEKMQ